MFSFLSVNHDLLKENVIVNFHMSLQMPFKKNLMLMLCKGQERVLKGNYIQSTYSLSCILKLNWFTQCLFKLGMQILNLNNSWTTLTIDNRLNVTTAWAQQSQYYIVL